MLFISLKEGMHIRQHLSLHVPQPRQDDVTQTKTGTFVLTQSTSILPSSLAPMKDLASSRGLEGRKTSTELTATWGGLPGDEPQHDWDWGAQWFHLWSPFIFELFVYDFSFKNEMKGEVKKKKKTLVPVPRDTTTLSFLVSFSRP